MADLIFTPSTPAPAATPATQGKPQGNQEGEGEGTPAPKGKAPGSGGAPNPIAAAARAAEKAPRTLGDEIAGGGREEGEPHEGEQDDTTLEGEEHNETDADPESPKAKIRELLAKMSPQELEEAVGDHKFKFKVKGQDMAATLPELLRLAGQGGRMFQAMEEAAGLRRNNERYGDIFKRIQSDPDQWIELGRQLGHDVDAHMKKSVYEKLKIELMDDSERAQYEKDQELEKFRNKDRTEKEKADKEAADAARGEVKATLQNEIFDFFKGRERPDNAVMARTFEVMIQSRAEGEPLPVARAFEIADTEIQRLLEKRLESLPPEKLPPSLREKVRQHEVAKFRTQPRRPSAPAERAPPPPERTSAKGPVSVDDMFRRMEEKYAK